jgi:tRNA pseudouridine55 synthase
MDGVIVINKPKGFTSFDVVAVIRKLYNTKKVGHCGTLDPMATGVLPILLGRGAKAQSILPDSDKAYIADIKFGILTDTLDIEGHIIKTQKSNITKCNLEFALGDFKGEIMQVPPMYSAIKKDGVRLYELARKGIDIKREARKIFIKELRLLDFSCENQTAKIEVYCSKGTYIRSLAYDLGKNLGAYATLTGLKRVLSSGFSLEQSLSLEDLKFMDKEKLLDKIKPIDSLFYGYQKATISDAQAKRYRNGGYLDIERVYDLKNKVILNDEIIRIYDNFNTFLGLSKVDFIKKQLKHFKLFYI